MALQEYGPSGPTQVKDMDAAGTGLSNEAAAFVAAHCSPFTNPRDMPVPPKVPDPRNTQPTETMFIWGHFDIPGIPDSGNTSSGQLIVTSADPLAPVPIKWASGTAQAEDTTNWCTPMNVARSYEGVGLHKVVSQMRSLGQRSKSYRIVGHGLKVWVSRNTNVSRGTIEAGQFQQTACINAIPSDPAARRINNAKVFATWYNNPGQSVKGFQATAAATSCLAALRRSIEGAKEQEVGFLSADEGCTVRWTDSDEYDFQPTFDRGYAVNMKAGSPDAPQSYIDWQTVNFTGTNEEYTTNRIKAAPTCSTNTTLVSPWNDINSVGVLSFTDNTSGFVAPASASNDNWYMTADQVSTNYLDWEGRSLHPYYTSSEAQFTKGLFADVQGLDVSQTLTVQVCWHVEYIPNNFEPWAVMDSPVDPQFDEIAAMVRNSRAFPVVVKGHSFFSSLKRAMGKAVTFAGKIFSGFGGTVGGLMTASGDPRLMALGAGMTAVHGAMERKRRARELADTLD